MAMGTGDGSHRFFEDMAVSHVLGGLDESDGRVFRSHLLECADCRARVGELRAIAHELADVERDERRMRAAQSIETKRRESEDDEADEDEPRRASRSGRVILVAGLVVIALLAAWNFTLRGTVARQSTAIDDLQDGSEVLQLGEPAVIRPSHEGVHAQVKVHEGKIVVLVNGLEDGQLYGVYGVDEDTVTFSRGWAATNGTLHVLIRGPGEASEVIVTEYSGQLPTRPTGTRVLAARLPRSP